MKKVMKENKGVLILAATLVIGVTLIICGCIGALASIAAPTTSEDVVPGTPTDELPSELPTETPSDSLIPQESYHETIKMDDDPIVKLSAEEEEALAQSMLDAYTPKLDAMQAKVDAADPAAVSVKELSALFAETKALTEDVLDNVIQEAALGCRFIDNKLYKANLLSKETASKLYGLHSRAWEIRYTAEDKIYQGRYGIAWTVDGSTVTFTNAAKSVDWADRSYLDPEAVNYYYQRLTTLLLFTNEPDDKIILPDGTSTTVSKLGFTEAFKKVLEGFGLPLKEAYLTFGELDEIVEEDGTGKTLWTKSTISFEKPEAKAGQCAMRVYTMLFDEKEFESDAAYKQAILDCYKGEICLAPGGSQLTTHSSPQVPGSPLPITGTPYTLFLMSADEKIGTVGFVGNDVPGCSGIGVSFLGFRNFGEENNG